MLRLALGNAPVQTCSRRALSSIVTKRPGQWTRGRKYNSTKASGGAGKKDEKLSSDKALRVDTPAKPTVSSPDASHAGNNLTKKQQESPASTSAPTEPTPSKTLEATVVEEKATPTRKVVDSKPAKEAPEPKVATGSTPIHAAQQAAAALEATATPNAQVETTIDSTAQASSRVKPSPTTPLSEVPPPQAEEALEEAAIPTQSSLKDAKVKSKKLKTQQEVEEFDEDEEFDFANVDTSVEEATVKLLQSEEFMQTLQSGTEPQGPLETPDFGGFTSTPEETPRLRSREELGDNFTEAEWHSSIVHGRGVHLPFQHPRSHSVPVALIHFRSHSPEQLALFTHFARHAAASLGIPCSGVASLPTKRTLWTVIKGPFAHKKTQENFERRVHKRAIKAWDAHPEVVDLWAAYLRRHAMGGVGMRVVKWTRAPVGVGQQMMERARKRMSKEDKVRKMGEEIIQAEMRRDIPAVEQ